MRPLPAFAAVSLLALSSCLETEEDIEVRPDGSVQVTLRASGNLWDVAAGYPLPFGGAWEPVDDTTRLWVREVARATGGALVRERLEAGAWTPYRLRRLILFGLSPQLDFSGFHTRLNNDQAISPPTSEISFENRWGDSTPNDALWVSRRNPGCWRERLARQPAHTTRS